MATLAGAAADTLAGAVGAAGAAALAAANGLTAIADLAGAAADHLAGAERKVPALDEEAPGKDHQAPEVVLVEGADLPDEAAVEAHDQLFHSWPAPAERPTSQGGSAACPPRSARGAATPPWTPLATRTRWRRP